MRVRLPQCDLGTNVRGLKYEGLTMDRAWDGMVALAIARGFKQLAWGMTHGCWDEDSMIDRQRIRQILTGQ